MDRINPDAQVYLRRDRRPAGDLVHLLLVNGYTAAGPQLRPILVGASARHLVDPFTVDGTPAPAPGWVQMTCVQDALHVETTGPAGAARDQVQLLLARVRAAI